MCDIFFCIPLCVTNNLTKMVQRSLAQEHIDTENSPVVHPANNIGGEGHLNGNWTWTWKFLFLLLGLLFLLVVFNMAVFFILQSIFITPSSQMISSELKRELARIINATVKRNIEETPIVSKSCGGIMYISRHQNGYIFNYKEKNERCAWIIKSDTKKIKVQYANQSLGISSGTVIAELDDGDAGLSCSILSSGSAQIVRTPFVLYFTQHERNFSDWIKTMVIELTPVNYFGIHESQPVTYHIDKMTKGSLPLAVAPARTDSLLEMMTVFQTQQPAGAGREFTCSPRGTNQCCDYITAQIVEPFSVGGTCSKMSKLNEGNGKQYTDNTVIVLYWSHKIVNESECRLTWSECWFPRYCG